MERQLGGRVSVSVFPTFQSDVEIAKVEHDTGPPPPQSRVGDLSVPGGGYVNAAMGSPVTDHIPDVRMVMKQQNGNYEGAPAHRPYPPSSLISQQAMVRMEKPMWQKMLINCLSELGGTYILVFLGCMGCVAGMSGGSVPHLQVSFIFGFAVLIAVQVFGHVSGAHINPIVTVASLVMGYTPATMVPVYLIGQFLGAIAGYGTVMLLTPSEYLNNQIVGGVKAIGVCSPALHPELSPVQGLIVEFVASSMLVLVCCAVWDRKNTDKHDSLSIRFGLTIAVLAMAAGPYSGANMNPARSFAPALLNGDWGNHWVYWVGPLLAGSVTASAYKFLFNTPPPEEKLPESIPLN